MCGEIKEGSPGGAQLSIPYPPEVSISVGICVPIKQPEMCTLDDLVGNGSDSIPDGGTASFGVKYAGTSISHSDMCLQAGLGFGSPVNIKKDIGPIF